jgi:hypothetical protein
LERRSHDWRQSAGVGAKPARWAIHDRAQKRIQLNAAGDVESKLKTPWRDGTTRLIMSPREFMQRLATMVPRPRHLIA